MTKKLIKKLRREATANPKKAAILGVLFLVAIYFWMPLVGRWISREKDQPQAGSATAPTSSPTSAPSQALPTVRATASPSTIPVQGVPAPGATATAPNPTWRELADAIDHDPLMRPAAPVTEEPARPNPFARPRPVEKVIVEETNELKSNESLADDARPAELGLVLSSTVVGAARQTAMINGKVYTLGREVPTADGAVFRLTDIQPRRIVLTRAGREFELKMVVQDSNLR